MQIEVGKEYKRSQLHDAFGGNRQGGIASCAKVDIVFLFTGETGEQYGYSDGWDDEYFMYTGEGQAGDMVFARGNAAVRDHEQNGKRLILMQTTQPTFVTEGAEPVPKLDKRAFIYVEITPMVANFDVKGKMRYVQITTSLQTRDSDSGDTIKNNIPLIQSDRLTLMQGADFNEINSADGKARFIKQIEKSVNNMFKDGPKPFEIERAMITGFVIQ